MAEKKIEPKRPTGDEKAAGTRKAEKKSPAQAEEALPQADHEALQATSAELHRKRARSPGHRPGLRAVQDWRSVAAPRARLRAVPDATHGLDHRDGRGSRARGARSQGDRAARRRRGGPPVPPGHLPLPPGRSLARRRTSWSTDGSRSAPSPRPEAGCCTRRSTRPQFLGELGVLGDLPRSADLLTLDDSDVWSAPGEDFIAFVTGPAERLAPAARRARPPDPGASGFRRRPPVPRPEGPGRQAAPADGDVLARRSAGAGTTVGAITHADLASLCGGSRENVTRVRPDFSDAGW